MTNKPFYIPEHVAAITQDGDIREFLTRLDTNFNRRFGELAAIPPGQQPADDAPIAFRLDYPKNAVRVHYYTLDERKPFANTMVKILEPEGDVPPERREAYAAAATALLKEKKLFSKEEELSPEYLSMILRKRLRGLVADAPQEYVGENGLKGVYNVKVDRDHYTYNGADIVKYGLIFQMGPPSFVEQQANGYVTAPVKWELSLNTQNERNADALMKQAIEIMEAEGFREYVPQRQKKSVPSVDPATIDIDAIDLDKKGYVRKDSPAVLIRKASSGYGALAFSTDTQNPAAQHTILERTKDFVRQHQESGKEFTMPELKSYAKKKLITPAERAPRHSPRKRDLRIIEVGEPPKPKIRLFTPILRQDGSGQYLAVLRFAPPDTESRSVGASEMSIPLNTSDRASAQDLLPLLQDVTEFTLQDYFDQHPDTQLVTEFSERGFGHGHINVPVFSTPEILQPRDDGKIYFHELRDQINHTLEGWPHFMRWHFERELAEDGMQQLHLKPTTLQGMPVNGQLTQLADGFTLKLPTAAADDFEAQFLRDFNHHQLSISPHATDEGRSALVLRALTRAFNSNMKEHNAIPVEDSPNAQILKLISNGSFRPPVLAQGSNFTNRLDSPTISGYRGGDRY